MFIIFKALKTIWQHAPEAAHRGDECTKAGDGALQAPCGEFDSHRLQNIVFFVVRLIVQWIERLASNERVPGSNPGKAANPSLAQRTEHGATNADLRRFESCMRVHLPLAQLVAQVPS